MCLMREPSESFIDIVKYMLEDSCKSIFLDGEGDAYEANKGDI